VLLCIVDCGVREDMMGEEDERSWISGESVDIDVLCCEGNWMNGPWLRNFGDENEAVGGGGGGGPKGA
jgi:hypothetical protein